MWAGRISGTGSGAGIGRDAGRSVALPSGGGTDGIAGGLGLEAARVQEAAADSIVPRGGVVRAAGFPVLVRRGIIAGPGARERGVGRGGIAVRRANSSRA